MPRLETTELVLIRCIIVNNNQQQNSRVLPKFVNLNKSSGQLLNISPKNLIFSEKFKSQFPNLLEVED